MTLEDSFDYIGFEEYLKRNGVAQNSIKIYVVNIRVFYRYLDKNYPNEMNNKILYEFLMQRKRIWTMRFSIKHLFEFINKPEIYVDFMKQYKGKFKMQKRRLAKKSISFEQIKQIVNECRMPFRLIAMIQYDTGCRAGDVLNIKLGNISVTKDNKISITIREQKTGMIRTIFISDDSSYVLTQWISDKAITDSNQQIFNLKYVSYIAYIKKIGVKLNMPELATHHFRVSRACHLLEKGFSIIDVQKLLGHQNINNTLVYLQEMGTDSKAIMEKEKINWGNE